MVNEDSVSVAATIQKGLLVVADGTGKRGTVCRNGFTDASADAICHRMGWGRHSWWGTSEDLTGWDYRWDADILLSDVDCHGEVWETCSATVNPTETDCSHDDDVFLKCEGGDEVWPVSTSPPLARHT